MLATHSGHTGAVSRVGVLLAVMVLLQVFGSDGTQADHSAVRRQQRCPGRCTCRQSLVVDCTNTGVSSVPAGIPATTSTLLLPNNSITQLEPGTFHNLTSLLRLDLSRNKISLLYSGSFDGLASLQVLLLAFNRLSSYLAYPVDVFQSTPVLQQLFIQGNCKRDSHCSYPDKALQVLHNLKEIFLDAVADQPLGQGFRGLHSLESLKFFGYLPTLTRETFGVLRGLPVSSLDVAACSVGAIEPFTFSGLRNLTSLSVRDNPGLCEAGMRNLTHGLNSTRLRSLTLHYACNTEPVDLHADTLIGLRGTPLENLDLSDIKLRRIDPLVMINLPKSLKRLSIRDNIINDVSFLVVMYKMTELRWLDGSFQNQLRSLAESASFDNISNQRNRVSYVSVCTSNVSASNSQKATGDITYVTPFPSEVLSWASARTKRGKATFGSRIMLPPRLETFLMSHLKLNYSVPTLRIDSQNSLKHFDASYNELWGICGGIYGLHSLEVLDISYNRLVYMHPDSFCDLLNLQRLHLQGNQIGKTIMSDIPCRLFGRLSTLQDLDLGNNGIKRLQWCLFSNLSSLKWLRLNKNSLTILDFDVSGLESLELLDLSDNLIQYVSADSAAQLSQIALGRRSVTLCLAGNQNLLCTCDQQRFLHWMVATAVSIQTHPNVKCKFKNSSVVSLENPRLVNRILADACLSPLVLTGCIVGFLFLSILLGAIAAVYSQRWKLRYLYYVGKRTVNPYHPIEETTIELTFDAYISYDQIFELPDGRSMHQFVTNTVYPALTARGLSVRIRDELESGKLLHDVISGAIRQSDTVVVFLTSHYCSDFWNTFEFNMAAYEGIYTKRQVIIPVVLNMVHTKDLTPDILAFVRANPVFNFATGFTEDHREQLLMDALEQQIRRRHTSMRSNRD